MNGMPRVRSASLTDHPVCPRRVRVRPPCDGGCACRHKRLRIGAVVPDPTTQQHARSPQPLTVKCTGIYLIVFAPVCRVCRAAVLMEQHMCPAQAPIRKMHGHLRRCGGSILLFKQMYVRIDHHYENFLSRHRHTASMVRRVLGKQCLRAARHGGREAQQAVAG